ncbi:TatD family hydrolase [Mediterranea massiliensis]|uniref:TatD family hydrolase n=1 Tax=Mediterranea massiliensis TaxID=1841865 RepID=UPI0025A31CA4|nr:TatD family hydrolase [Mediterranea massiliensis]MDM8338232.1 TatD family hydrolase [Mediterranea massiliensis]
MLIDTHSHLFLEEFAEDLETVIERAQIAGVSHIFMPNIDSTTIESLLGVCSRYDNYCFPMIGLHPTSVNENYHSELDVVLRELKSDKKYVAIGEVGMDFYWDKTYEKEQAAVLSKQLEWALDFDLPVVIHYRDAFDSICEVLRKFSGSSLRGIFHSFTGTAAEAMYLMEHFDFLLGINGIVTFKKSTIPDVLKVIPLEKIVLETDSPYLAPVPCRGRRNESANVKYVLLKVAEIYGKTPEEVAKITSESALKVFGMLK